MIHPLIEPLEARIAPATIAISTPANFTEGNGGSQDLVFTVTLTGDITSDVTVHFATTDGTAKTSDLDYTSKTGTLTFHPGDTQQFIRVPIIGDLKHENNETFTVTLDSPTGEGELDSGASTATGMIANDDPVPTVSVENLSIAEGNSGTKNAIFNVRLSNPSMDAITVNAATMDGTATAGSDYVAVGSTLISFAPGETLKTFTVPIIGDVLDEADETVLVKLSNPTNVTLGSDGVGTIVNDDIRVRVEDATINEANADTTIQFAVKLSTAATQVVTVNFQTADGSATGQAVGGDYVAKSGFVTFQPGETVKLVDVTIVGDTVGEATENFFLNLTGATNASIFRPQAVGTILDDDPAFSIADVQVREGGPGETTMAIFTIQLAHGPSDKTLLIDVATMDGTATTAGSDYVPDTKTLTFAPGETSKTFSVLVAGDSAVEPNETFSVKLSNVRTPQPGATMGETNPFPNAIARGTAVGTILNDDGVVFSVNDVTITEGDSGTANAIFVVSLLGSPGQEVKVDVKTRDGSAVSTGDAPDFIATTQTLTFSSTQTQQIFSVPIRGDLTKESTETFSVLLSNIVFTSSGGMGSFLKSEGIGTILDNNDPAPTVSISNGRLVEGASGATGYMLFEVTLSKAASELVTVHFKTQDGTGPNAATVANQDYIGFADNIATIEPGQTTTTVAVAIRGDNVDESDETFGVTLFNPSGATLGVATATGTILNDDVIISVVVRPEDSPSVVEGDSGTKTITFLVKLDHAPVGHDVTVNFATVDDSSISTGANADYVSKTGQLTFTPGNGGVAQAVTVTVKGDTRVELDEQFFLRLISSVNGTIDPAKTSAAGIIANDDGAPQVSIQAAQITEGDPGTTKTMSFTVKLDEASDAPVSVSARTQDGTATTANNDYTAVSGQIITFAPGETSKTFNVSVIGDLNDEPTETFSVILSAPVNATISNGTAIGTILDNDARTVSINDVTIVEGNAGTSTMVFTVALSGPAMQEIKVDVATADGSAVSTGGTSDYVAKTETLTFAPGVTSQTFVVTVNGDTTVEGNERFFVNLSNVVNGLLSSKQQAVGLILDDETTVRLALPVGASAMVDEEIGTGRAQSFAVFQVVREGDLSNAVTVQYMTVDGTAVGTGDRRDFIPQSGTISFAAGSSVASARIEVPIVKDFNYENNETFQVRLFNPLNAAVSNGTMAVLEASSTVTIVDNDVAPTVSIASARLVEPDGGSAIMTFTATLSAANERDVATVDYKFTDGPGDTGAHKAVQGLLLQDYTGTDGTLTFSRGTTTQTIAVPILGDLRDEADEEVFFIDLSNQKNGSVVNPNGITTGRATGTIVDNDAAPTLRFSGTAGGDITVTEGNAGVSNAVFTLELSEVSERAVQVDVSTKDGTAVSTGLSADFGALTGFHALYTPGTLSKTFTFSVPIFGDLKDEANETFKVLLSNAQFARISDNGAIATISDDDAAPTVAINNASILEGNSGTQDLVFTVSLSAPSGQVVTVDYRTLDGTAVSSGPLADYLAKAGTLTFQPDEISKEVRIKINGDTFLEADEQFTVSLASAGNSTLASGASSGVGRILNDGDTTVGIVIGNAFTAEGDAGGRIATFKVELTGPLPSATTFKIKASNGTAVVGDDFSNPSAGPYTIAGGSLSTLVTVTVIGDSVFEPTESFFINLRNVSGSVQIIDGTGRGTIYNDDLNRLDGRTIQYIDVDGDLATVRVSKGGLDTPDLFFGAVNKIGGRQLAAIDFTDDGDEFQDADITVSAKAQAGFRGNPKGRLGDGHVNVGFIRAAIPQSAGFQFLNAHDLGTVKIDGDLGKIVAGDTFADSAIKSLQVRSMGALGTRTQGSATDTSIDVVSQVLGPIGSLNVAGKFGGSLQVIGERFGKIKNFAIGSIVGGSGDFSGQIFFTGRLAHGFIGEIIGGSGNNSGVLTGGTGASIGTLVVAGGLVGGAGAGSGRIVATTIDSLEVATIVGGTGNVSGVIGSSALTKLVVKGDIVGGAGRNAGEISVSGTAETIKIKGGLYGGDKRDAGSIVTNGDADRITIANGIFGGRGKSSGSVQVGGTLGFLATAGIVGFSGEKSGTITTGGKVKDLRIFGNIQGGAGTGSGGVVTGGKLVSATISGNIIGGDSLAAAGIQPATSVSKSGYVIANKIANFYLNGDLVAGHNDGAGLLLSGTIRSKTTIGSLTVHGGVIGNESAAAIIAAPGTAVTPLAIKRLTIDGSTDFAEILAGYSAAATNAAVRGGAVNADARIGTVTIAGSIQDTSIVAGVTAGADGLFGTADDVLIGGSGTRDVATSYAKIARIVVGGAVKTGTKSAGFVGQFVGQVTTGGVNFALSAGPGNDGDRTRELAPGSNIHVFEVPLPA